MMIEQTGPLDREDRLAAALVGCLEALDSGPLADRAALLARYPEFATELARFLDDQEQVECCAAPLRAVAALHPAAEMAEHFSVPKELGDFRILREVGRGGMGIVYEAQQISLRRRVALKVLPFAATMDARHLQRFHNEAQAAACLHHTNIVPVFFVGCERGVHFYAMQFIDGQPLSDLIRQLRGREKTASLSVGEARTEVYQPAPGDAPATMPPAAEMTPLTGEGKRGRDYYRKVAELGVQAAEALDHAHQLGIVHRDIKPGNLLLDGRGNLWVTDFGLAHIQQSEANLTVTGQAVGTPRYMSPEQVLAKRVPIDHRTDVYSLGATLYELLTLRPAFESEDRQELLRQIALDEPAAPRRLNKAIPAELETIVLKGMEKNPAERYASAHELADDLRRWLHDEPIRARRASWVQVGRKWARRHQSAVRAASVLLMVVMLLGFGFALWWVQKRAEAVTEARTDLEEAQRLRTVEKWSEALSAVRRAQAVLRDFGSDVHLRHQVEQLGKDLEMARRLEEARLQGAVVKDGHFDVDSCIAAFVEAFAWYGLDVEHGDADATAEFIRSRAISPQLVAALDFWASLLNPLKQSQKRSHLLAVARAADPDEWRNRWRDAWERQDGTAMNDLLASADSEKLLPTTLCLLGISVDKHEKVASERAAILLRRAQQQHPADFWINHDLALLLHDSQPRRPEEVIGFFRVAVALRPESPGVHNNLGVVLDENRQSDEAITEYRQAIRLKEDYAEAYYNLGIAWKTKGQLDEAIEEFREATRLKKDYAEAHNSLANALRHKGRPDEAIIEYHEVCRIRKNLPEAYKAYYNLGTLLHEKGQLDEAIEEFREATRLKEDYAEAHNNLGTALATKGQLDEAIDEFRTAIRVEKNFPEAYKAHNNLGNALRAKRQLDEAIAEYNTAIRLKKDFAEAHNNLGAALQKKGRLDEAIAEFREAIRLKKAFVEAHTNLGTALATKGQLDDAIAEFRETTRLERENPVAHFNLGIALATKGHLDEAIAEYREAIRLKKDYAAAHNNLGTALATKGQLDDAIAEFRTAIRLKKDFAEAHNNLGAALQEKGRLDEAIAEFREAIHVKKDYAQAHNNLKEALALRETLSKLGAILSGKAKADNAAEQLALASVCQAPYKRLYAAAARFYRDAFAAQPHLADDLDAQHRYKAACAAALAGCGQGKDADKLDAKERARLRQQALDWLRADLKAYRQVMEKAADKAGPAIAQRMQHWLKDDDFAGVREADTLARLPEAERLEWHKLWEEVKALRQRAAQPPKTTSSARP